MNEKIWSFRKWRKQRQIVIGKISKILYTPLLSKVGANYNINNFKEKHQITCLIIRQKKLVHCDRTKAGKFICKVLIYYAVQCKLTFWLPNFDKRCRFQPRFSFLALMTLNVLLKKLFFYQKDRFPEV